MAKIRRRSWKTPAGEIREAWIADYKDQSGTRRLKTFTTRREADAWLVGARSEVAAGTHTAASASITVAEACARWIAHGEAEGLERGTLRQRSQHIKHHIVPFIGATKLATLTLPAVNNFLDKLRDADRSSVMRRKVLVSLKSAITCAQREGLVAQNVATPAKVATDKRRACKGPLRPGHDFPSKQEVNALIERTPADRRAFVLMLCFTAMRIGELRGLRWSDVDLAAGVAHIRQRIDAWCQADAPKSAAGKRDIPLTPSTVNALKEWKLRCPKGDANLVFPNSLGRPQWAQDLENRFWKPLQVEAGVVDERGKAKYGFHACRHFGASLFIESLGWTPKQVQTVVGHSSITMTYDTYGHLFKNPEADSAAMARMEKAVRAVS